MTAPMNFGLALELHQLNFGLALGLHQLKALKDLQK
jgi:hypothetical protein